MQRVRIKFRTITCAAQALLLSVIGIAACGGESSDGGGLCDQAVRKLRNCELLTEGSFDCEEPDSNEQRCQVRCLLQASCTELEAVVCEDEDADEGPVGSCFETCESAAGEDEFACADGSAIPAEWRCDGGLPDCDGGEDEAGCPSFTCVAGETVSEHARCDGFAECSNAADEAGCPTFSCGDGETVPESFRCDGDSDCAGGADEAGCARPICGGEGPTPSPPATPPPTIGPGAVTCEQASEKLRGCGLLSAGEFSCEEPVTEDQRCTGACLVNATCADLSGLFCSNRGGVELEACLAACEGPATFACNDGNSIPVTWRCDGEPDCLAGDDEASCPTFSCGNGESVPASYRCDGFAECSDGSDETACPTFSCGGIDTVPESYRCDGEVDCASGADEAGCAELVCGTN